MASRSDTWFERVMWVGILGNMAMAVPALLWPAQMLAMFGLPAAVPLVWVRFSSLLLLLLSGFYLPAAVDCRRFRVNAWLATAARLAGVVFFLTQARDYWLFSAYDFVFFVPEALLLTVGRAGAAPD